MLTNQERLTVRKGRALVRVVAVGLVMAATMRPARAERAADLIQEGVALRRKGDDEGALRRFQKAFDLEKSPRAQGQMGLAEQALGRWVQAYQDLSHALEAATDPWVGKNATTLRGALADVGEHVGKLDILGGSPDADVSVDGVTRGKLPLASPLILPIGVVSLRLSGAGLVPVQRSTEIRAHQVTRESFDALAAASSPPPVAPPEPVALPVAVTTTPVAAPRAAEAPPSSPDRGGPSAARASAKWIAWGGAAVALGVGVFGYARQSSATGDFNDNCMVDSTGSAVPATGKAVTSDQCHAWKNRRDSGFALEVGGLIGFAAAAGTGVVLWLTEPKASENQAAFRACAPAIGGGALAIGCGWRF